MSADRASPLLIQSVERAAALMRCFTEAQPELGVTELSRQLNLHKSTVSRILSTLQKEGFVSQNPTTGKYRLGVGLISLAGVALGRVDVRGAAYPYLDALVEQTQESADVSVLDGAACVNVLHKPSPRPLHYAMWIGRRLPLHCTASGKVLLAGLSAEERARLLPGQLIRHTPATIDSAARLAEELVLVADQGYALALEEYEEGYNAVAAPIRNHDGRVVGALSLSGPAFRLGRETLREFAAPLLATARLISGEMGYSGQPHYARDGGRR
ncbi:MAG: IclR family transcriptional regulator [Candidatus Promineofilum sp.]|nr:IclR family transcriptional regulator [Promineifilum sp.]